MASMASEVLLTAEATGQLWSVAAYDVSTGSNVGSFKGLPLAPHCLALRADHTLMGAALTKPVLQLWPLSKQAESHQEKIQCPGMVSSMAVFPDGNFCVACIRDSTDDSDKTFIWELSAGELLYVGKNNDEVKVIRFTHDGSHFVTGSSSGNINIWHFATVVSRSANKVRAPQPVHTIHAHSQTVTDVFVGIGGPAARIASSSLDRTVKLWDMLSGRLLRTLTYDVPVCSVLLAHADMWLCAGLHSGDIICTPVYSQVMQAEEFISQTAERKGQRILSGHSGPVMCLCLSHDGSRLASACVSGRRGRESEGRGEVRIWTVDSGDSLSLPSHAGEVSNLLMVPYSVFHSAPTFPHPPVSFQPRVDATDTHRGRLICVQHSHSSQGDVPDISSEIRSLMQDITDMQGPERSRSKDEDCEDQLGLLQEENARLKQANADLYNFMAKKILSQDNTPKTETSACKETHSTTSSKAKKKKKGKK